MDQGDGKSRKGGNQKSCGISGWVGKQVNDKTHGKKKQPISFIGKTRAPKGVNTN